MIRKSHFFIFAFILCLINGFAQADEPLCKKNIKGMEYFKDLNNERKWIMRSNYFKIPKIWSIHGTFDHLALAKEKFPDGDKYSVDILIKTSKGITKRLVSYKFISHENYFRSSGKSFAPLIQKHRGHGHRGPRDLAVVFILKDSERKPVCEFTLPFPEDEG